MTNRLRLTSFLLILLMFSSCKLQQPVAQKKKPVAKTEQKQNPEAGEIPAPAQNTEEEIPVVKELRSNSPLDIHEFRAAWVASVANINWPSKPDLSTSDQQREALKILDFLAEHNFNAVIFQVRPQADALYDSKLEPWSYFLTGKQGNAPDPYYDPLKFWIQAAHNRGLELHVWLNPYRAHHTTAGEITDASIIRKKPELAVELEEWNVVARSR